MSKKKWNLARLCIGGVLLVATLALHYAPVPDWCEWLSLGLALAGYLLVGYDVLWRGVRSVFRRSLLDENFLMAIASVGAFVIGEYAEGLAVILFYKVGEYFEKLAVARSRKSIRALVSIAVDEAWVLTDEGLASVPCADVAVGSIVVVKAGERVPLDGEVVSGFANVDTSAITGESVPREVEIGSTVASGSIVLDGSLHVRTTCEFGESTANRMIRLVEEARTSKAPEERFISRFARVYTPVVVAVALVLAILPPLIIDYDSWSVWAEWLKRGLVFLVVSCPCALVISVPLSYFGAIGAASRKGILLKGGHVFGKLARLEVVALDKTGTLREGRFAVSAVLPEENRERILQAAAIAEAESNHPIARAILAEVGSVREDGWTYSEKSGMGVCATGAHRILAGNRRYFEAEGIAIPDRAAEGTVVHVAEDGKYLGCVCLADIVRPRAKESLLRMQEAGIRTVMLTGDRQDIAVRVGRDVGATEVHAELMPEDKVRIVDELKKEGVVAFVGDGINDAPVIATADVGFALGGIGQDAAIESADAVLMNDDVEKVLESRNIARKTQRIVKENIVLALFVKLAVMGLSLSPLSTHSMMMWLAVVADVGVAVVAIANALRAGRLRSK